jgi:hypothetical protein
MRARTTRSGRSPREARGKPRFPLADAIKTQEAPIATWY